jgi:hypothetical protein
MQGEGVRNRTRRQNTLGGGPWCSSHETTVYLEHRHACWEESGKSQALIHRREDRTPVVQSAWETPKSEK